MERLQKVIARSGLYSRREAEELIKSGQVYVNGHLVTELGAQAEYTDTIRVKGKNLPAAPQLVTYIVNKPKGVVCSTEKQGTGKIITELVPVFPSVNPIGRLDKDSEGLILLTNDGGLHQAVSHPSHQHEKEYRVVCSWEKDVTKRELSLVKSKLLKGVRLGDGVAKATAVRVHEEGGSVSLVITVEEGRHHLVRRMCASVGLSVRRLTRTRIGTIQLGNLKSGTHRLLTEKELASLRDQK